MPDDNLVTVLADVAEAAYRSSPEEDPASRWDDVVRALLARRDLITPTSELTAKAQEWETDHDKSWERWADIDRSGKDCAAELRAITRQETTR